MASINVNKTWTALASDYCFTTFDQLGSDILDNMGLTMSGDFTLINRGSTAPTGVNQNYLWFDTGSQRLYEYIGGVWVARHPVPITSSERRIWKNTASNLWTYDGGDGTDPGIDGNVSNTTGSFWEVDTDFAGRMPLGAGTLASGTVVNVDDTGGAEEVTLDITEMPSHRHAEANGNRFVHTEDSSDTGDVGVGEDSAFPLSGGELNTDYAGGDPDDSNNTVAHNNMPPYYGVHLIKRTNRVYYTAGGTAGAISLGNGVYFGSGAPAFTPVEGFGQYIDHTTRDLYIWSSTTNSWTL